MSRAFRKYHKSLQTTRVSRTAVEGLPYSEMGRANLPSSVKRAKKEAATTFFSSRQFTRSAKSSAPQWTAMPHSWPLLCPSPKSVLRFSRSPPLVLTDRNDKQIVKTGSWREQSEGEPRGTACAVSFQDSAPSPTSPLLLRSYVVQARFSCFNTL